MRYRSAAVIAAVLAASVLGGGTALADTGKPGADGAGDSYYPQDGNGGYDVADYNLKVGYEPATKQLTGLQTITGRTTQSLSSFNLDLRGLTVDSIKVNGRKATFTR